MPGFDFEALKKRVNEPLPGEQEKEKPRGESFEDLLKRVNAPLPETSSEAAPAAPRELTKPGDLAENQNVFERIGAAFRGTDFADAALAAAQGATFNYGDELVEGAANQFGKEEWGKEAGQALRSAAKNNPLSQGAGSMIPATAAAAYAAPVIGMGVGAGALLGGLQGLLSGRGVQEGEDPSWYKALDEGLLGMVGGAGGAYAGQALRGTGGALMRGARGLYNRAFPTPPTPRAAPTMHVEPVVPTSPSTAASGPRTSPGISVEPVPPANPLDELLMRNPEAASAEALGGYHNPGLRQDVRPRTFAYEALEEVPPDPIMRGASQYDVVPQGPAPDILGRGVRRATPQRDVPVMNVQLQTQAARGPEGRFMPGEYDATIKSMTPTRERVELGGNRIAAPPGEPLEIPPPMPPQYRIEPVSSVRGPSGPPPPPIDLPPGPEPVYGMREVPPPLPREVPQPPPPTPGPDTIFDMKQVPPPLPVPPLPQPKAAPQKPLPSLLETAADFGRGRVFQGMGKVGQYATALADRMAGPSTPKAMPPSFLGRAAQLAPGKAAWELGAPYVANQTVYAQEGEPPTAYAGRAAMNYAVQAALTRGRALGLSQADEQALTAAVVQGDDRAISATDHRLRQLYPAYAAQVERELREMNTEE